MTILNKIKENAIRYPDRIAFQHETAACCGNRTGIPEKLTWQQLEDDSDFLAAYIDANFPDRTPVIVYGHKNPYMLVCFLACVKSARAYCPVDTSIPEQRVQAILDAVSPELILATEPFPLLRKYGTVLAAEQMRRIFCKGGGITGGVCPVLQDDVFYIIFTSGSTGAPKGVQITASCLDSFIQWALTLGSGIREGEHNIFLNQAPFSFDLSVMDLYLSLYTGGTLYALDKSLQQDLKELSKALERSGANIWVSTPSFVQMCLADRGFNSARLPWLKRFLFCGETLPVSVAKRLRSAFPEAEVVNTYGPTECTVAVTGVCITDEMLQLSSTLPLGTAKTGVQITIEDEQGRKLEDGRCGEIVITGDSVGAGYWKDPDRTRDVFRIRQTDGKAERSYYTGDLGYLSDGMLFYHGRKDLQVKLHGFRMELEDIENNLCRIAGVEQVCVLPNIRNGKISSLTAFMVYSGTYCDSIQLAKHLRRQAGELLPDYMIPKKMIFLKSLPVTNNGKVDRIKLAETGGKVP